MSELANHLIAYVDSHTRVSGTHTSFQHTINLPARNNFDSICVLQASIPKSYYLIAKGHNTFVLTENGVATTVQIPIGNYSRRSLATVLGLVLNANSPHNLHYAVTLPNVVTGPETGKFNYHVQNSAVDTGIPPYSVELSFTSDYQPCESMGFSINSTYTFSALTGDLVSENVCRLQARTNLYIKSDVVDNGGTGILQAIFGTEPDLSIIKFQVGTSGGIEANRKTLMLNRTNTFTFVITDEDGVLIDTNGLSISFSLLLWDSSKYSVYR